MFIHNFKYSIKTLFRNKMLIFWTFAFPIILGTLFNMAFANIEKDEKLDIIDIAIVNNEEFNNNQIYKEAFKELSNKDNKDRLFNIKYVNIDKANNLLSDNDITGYLVFNSKEPKVVVSTSEINQTILKYTVEEIRGTSKIIENISNKNIAQEMSLGNTNINYEKIYKDAAQIVQDSKSNIKDISSTNLSYTLIEFYTLIAMSCLYGGMLAMVSINKSLANMSNNGKRVAVSPISKGKIILSSVLASYITQLVGIALLFIYTIFVLNINYGSNLPLIILLSLAGSLAGLSVGIATSTFVKGNENIKTGIIISVTMLGCFLSGMMGITMKYIIDKNIPFINKINPASMITDGFYSLYYYDTLNRYLINIISLFVFAIILIGLSSLRLRGQKYDSI